MRAMWIMAGLMAAGSMAWGEELVLFDAQRAPEEAWSWSDAKIQRRSDQLIVSEINKAGDYGNVFVDTHYPYHPDAVLSVDVRSVLNGSYTIQVLAFQGETHIHTVDPIKNSVSTGSRALPMRDLKLPPETQSVRFKVWVAGAEGAAIALGNLRYSRTIEAEQIVLDEPLKTLTYWEADGTIPELVDGGVRVTLEEGAGFGSLLYEPMRTRRDGGQLMIHAPRVHYGTITIQLVCFDRDHLYLESVDAIRAVGAGWHGVSLGGVKWPDRTAYYKVKIWLGGEPGAEAVIGRLLEIEG